MVEQHEKRAMNARTIVVALAAVLAAIPVAAQWEKVPDRAIPRTAGGAPDLAASAPKIRGGKPDLSGIWLPDPSPFPGRVHAVEGDLPIPRHMVSVVADMKPEEVPIQPWAAELLDQRLASQGTISPMAHCKPTGVPWINAIPLPYKIVQMPHLILILYEESTVFRQIFLDGRKPVDDAQPRWMGYSTGRWDGDTLVVETVGVTDQSWLDGMGHPHTEEMRLIERFRRRDAGHLDIEITIEDPGAYTRPITYTITTTAVPEDDLLEYFCSENEKSSLNYE
jgi:hypothetical protein